MDLNHSPFIVELRGKAEVKRVIVTSIVGLKLRRARMLKHFTKRNNIQNYMTLIECHELWRPDHNDSIYGIKLTPLYYYVYSDLSGYFLHFINSTLILWGTADLIHTNNTDYSETVPRNFKLMILEKFSAC